MGGHVRLLFASDFWVLLTASSFAEEKSSANGPIRSAIKEKGARSNSIPKPVCETEIRPPIRPLPFLSFTYQLLKSRQKDTAESAANSSTEVMSLQPPEPNDANETNQAEGLKVWSCVNCRRRKVRCDRRHPCAPCTRNKTECVFPVSGRIPRRGRDANYPKPPAQKQAELLGRLRRLEAMIGDLGSQVEHAAVVSQGNHPVESSTSAINATSATSSETGWPDHRLALQSQSASGNPPTKRDGVQTSSGMAKGTSELPQIPEESGELVVASNGDLAIGNRFWTVFCKEVCSNSAPFCFALPTGVELGICN